MTQKRSPFQTVLYTMLTSCLLTVSAILPAAARAQTAAPVAGDPMVQAAAMAELTNFLTNDIARRAYADQKGGEVKKTNTFLESFPDYAKKEIIEIVLMIMNESGTGAERHVQAFKGGGTPAAISSFSPAVKARVDSLIKKIAADPVFNQPQNIEKLKQKMPNVDGKTS